MPKKVIPLTDTQLSKAKAKASRYSLRDGNGLELEIQPSGSKVWRFVYARPDGSRTKATFGEYPAVKLANARAWREECRALLAQGIDPQEHAKQEQARKQLAAESTFEALARKWLEKNQNKWAAITQRKISASLERHIFPVIGARPIEQLRAPDLVAVLEKAEAAGVLETASRLRQYMAGVFVFAEQRGVIDRNPAYALKGAISSPKTTHRPALPLERLPELVGRIGAYTGHPVTRAALALSLLTFVRSSELRYARWNEIDFDRALWTIPPERVPLEGIAHSHRGSKMKDEHLVPLSRQALEIFQQLRAITGEGELIFRLNRNPTPLSDATVNKALRGMGYDTKADICGHGFRAMACSALTESALWQRDAVERQMSHQERNSVRAAYIHKAEHLKDRRLMLQWWADYLDANKGEHITPHDFANPEEQAENVVKLERVQ